MIGMLWRGGRRFVYFMIVVVLGYLCQVCVMPYLAVNGVTASMLFAVTAIVTVCYGKLRAFWRQPWKADISATGGVRNTKGRCCGTPGRYGAGTYW